MRFVARTDRAALLPTPALVMIASYTPPMAIVIVVPQPARMPESAERPSPGGGGAGAAQSARPCLDVLGHVLSSRKRDCREKTQKTQKKQRLGTKRLSTDLLAARRLPISLFAFFFGLCTPGAVCTTERRSAQRNRHGAMEPHLRQITSSRCRSLSAVPKLTG